MGISKNAVVGKAHRLNLPGRPSSNQSSIDEAGLVISTGDEVTQPKLPRRRPKLEGAAVVGAAHARTQEILAQKINEQGKEAPIKHNETAVAVVPDGTDVRHTTYTRNEFNEAGKKTCCWPIGEPGTREFRFCTSEAVRGKPYCPEHAAIAHVKVRDRRADAV